MALSAAAQDAPGGADAAKKLDQRRQQLQATQQREKSLESDVTKLAAERERLTQQLVETAALIQKSEQQMSGMEARLGELDAQEKLLRGSLERRHGSIAKLMSALQRMGRNPPPVMITRREDALQMVRSAMLLAAAFPELRTQALELAGRLEELVRVMTEIRTEGDRLRSETVKLNDARVRLAGLMEIKRQSLSQRQAELDEVRKAAAEIARNVNDLSDLIARLDKVVTERTGLGEYQRDAQSAGAAPVPGSGSVATAEPVPTPGRPAATPPIPPLARSDQATGGKEGETKLAALVPPKLSPPVVELAPKGGSFGSPGRLAPAIPFHQAKARLPMPALGRRALGFGERKQLGGRSEGQFIETRTGAQITSPCDGWVVYAGPFRSYGQILIINAGGGYHVLLAGMSQVDVQLGQFVLAAEPVGTMAAASRAAAQKTQVNAPVLYVEFRKDGRPIDPDPWWADSSQKVQG
jgi:septal ring factor EnvC (AmiA/AmiB activator)